jgi:hypothetical protein
MLRTVLCLTAVVGLSVASVGCESKVSSKPAERVEMHSGSVVTSAELNKATSDWCAGLVAIGAASDPAREADRVLNELYGYESTGVLFKPTLTTGEQTFRNTRAGAKAYFVGGDSAFPGDKGFALKPWKTARYEAKKNVLRGDVAMTQGNLFLTAADGTEVMVDKTWVFVKGKDGKLRLAVHHSSLPYNP